MKKTLSRRDFMRSSALASTVLAAGASITTQPPARAANESASTVSAAPQPLLPTGKIGNLEITRLILGGNLLSRVQHHRDLGYLMKLVASYNSDSKVRETLELAEIKGINTLSVDNNPSVRKTLREHRKNGGKIQWILYSTANIEDAAHYKDELQQMIDDGAEAIYIWGCHADRYVAQGNLGILSKAIEEVKLAEIPCGMGAHDLRVVQECEKNKLPVDFYIKTFHHHRYPTAPQPGTANSIVSEIPGYWCNNPEATAAFMKTVSKPWIAFKIMAAGAIPPKDAFAYTFNNGADFALAGMFDFDIEEDCQITREVVIQAQGRTSRPWRA